MKRWFSRLGWFLSGAASMLILVGAAAWVLHKIYATDRPPGPPYGMKVSSPWGALDLNTLGRHPGMQNSIAKSFGEEFAEDFDADGDGVNKYPLLTLSGGGANGAFGAGVLCGWTESGTRPTFKVVTGVSVGALQAPFAFLGPKYDYALREIFTELTTNQIYTQRPISAAIWQDSIFDTGPLRKLVDKYLTKEVFDEIAREHREGRRLFVGTTCIDTREFTIWDMGEIANSKRPDAKEHFANVLMASCAIPVLFPPRYFTIEGENHHPYHEMHVDGGAVSQVFFRGFLLDFDDALKGRVRQNTAEIDLYVITNMPSHDPDHRYALPARMAPIASTMIEMLFDIAAESSLFRMYVLSHQYGARFHFVPFPNADQINPVDFCPEKMKPLFKVGFDMGNRPDAWEDHPPGLDPDEIYPPRQNGTTESVTRPATERVPHG